MLENQIRLKQCPLQATEEALFKEVELPFFFISAS